MAQAIALNVFPLPAARRGWRCSKGCRPRVALGTIRCRFWPPGCQFWAPGEPFWPLGLVLSPLGPCTAPLGAADCLMLDSTIIKQPKAPCRRHHFINGFNSQTLTKNTNKLSPHPVCIEDASLNRQISDAVGYSTGISQKILKNKGKCCPLFFSIVFPPYLMRPRRPGSRWSLHVLFHRNSEF